MRDENTIQDRIDRARKDVDLLKSTQYIGSDSSQLYVTTKPDSIVVPGPSNPAYKFPYIVEVTFTANNQLNAFCSLDYLVPVLNDFPIDHIQKRVSNDDSKISKFWVFFTNYGGTDITVNLTWYVLGTDSGVIS